MTQADEAGPPPLVCASFGRRGLALAIDLVILALGMVAIAWWVNALTGPVVGPVFAPLWDEPELTDRRFETGRDTTEKDASGATRHLKVGRESRLYANGWVRIYLVSDLTLTRPDGTTEETHFEQVIGRSSAEIRGRGVSFLYFFLTPIAYFTWLEGGARQASLGKRAVGLKVTDLAGRRVSWARALARQLLKLLGLTLSGFGYLIALLTARRQALHDLLGGTLVVAADAPATPTANQDRDPRWKSSPSSRA